MTPAQEHAYLAFLWLVRVRGRFQVRAGRLSDHSILPGVYNPKGKPASRLNRNGYRRVPFRFNGRRYEIMEHWAVWLASGRRWPRQGEQLNHKDLNRQNNHIENLELVTQSANLKHAHHMRKAGHPGGKR